MSKQNLQTSTIKLIMAVSLIVGIGAVIGVVAYYWTISESKVLIDNNTGKKRTVNETIEIDVYFNNKEKYDKLANEIGGKEVYKIYKIDDCGPVFSVKRFISKTDDKIEFSKSLLKELKNGPTEKEKARGFTYDKTFLEIIDNFEIEEDHLLVNFNKQKLEDWEKTINPRMLESLASCEWSIYFGFINRTFEQVPGIKTVRIADNIFTEKDETADWQTYRNEEIELSVKELDINQLKIGDEIGDFIVRDIKNNLVEFSGTTTVSGVAWHGKTRYEELMCFTVDESSVDKIPRFIGKEDMVNEFCFRNKDEVKDNLELYSKIRIEISDYSNYLSASSGGNAMFVKEITKDETADWKTYRNEEYGFEFKYPNIYIESSDCYDLFDTVCLGSFKNIENNSSIYFRIVDDNFDLQKIKIFAPTGNMEVPELRVMGENNFYYYGPGGGGVQYPDRYFYSLSSRTLVFEFDGPYINDKSPSQEISKLESQILSTFKFIEK